MKALDDCLRGDGILGLYEFGIAPVIDSARFCKAGDKSVLASINQIVFQVKCDLLEMGHPLPLVNRQLNRVPMSTLKYHYAVEAFLALAEPPRG